MDKIEYAPDDLIRVVTTIKNGETIERRLLDSDEHIATLSIFLEIAQQAGYIITRCKHAG